MTEEQRQQKLEECNADNKTCEDDDPPSVPTKHNRINTSNGLQLAQSAYLSNVSQLNKQGISKHGQAQSLNQSLLVSSPALPDQLGQAAEF